MTILYELGANLYVNITNRCPCRCTFCIRQKSDGIDLLIAVCKYLKEKDPDSVIRVNTNGLSDLIHGFPTVRLLKGLVDSVSISLNAPDAASYNRLCRPRFGEAAFDAMLTFAKECKHLLPEAILSVVDCISEQELKACQGVAREAGLPLRVREYAE